MAYLKIQESNKRLFLTIPTDYAKELNLKKGVKMFPFINKKGNLEYKKVEE